MHLSKSAQITQLKVDKALIKVSSKYTVFTNVFLLKLAIKFLEYTRINNHTIELVND